MTDHNDNADIEKFNEDAENTEISEDTENNSYENQDAEYMEDPYENIEDHSIEEKIIPDTAPYHVNYELYSDAYKCYQKHFVLPKNRILQLILLLLAVDFGYHGVTNPENKIAFMLLALCVALIFVLWYNPRRMRRSVMDVIREMDGDEYVFSMDEEKMTFSTVPSEYIQDVPNDEVYSPKPTELYYTKELYVVEKYEFFLICRGKQVFYVLPKYALYDNQAEIIRSFLEDKIGRRFRCKI